jgi:hypothetical protein
MIRFNRRGWILSIRASQLSHIDPRLRPSALALQAALVADGLADENTSAGWLDGGANAGAAGRASRRCMRRDRAVIHRTSVRARAAS